MFVICKGSNFIPLLGCGRVRHECTVVSYIVCRLGAFHVFRQVLEEIVSEGCGDTPQQGRVNAFALENVVHVLPVAIQLAGKPCHRTFLKAQCFLDFSADMYHWRSGMNVWGRTTEAPVNVNKMFT